MSAAQKRLMTIEEFVYWEDGQSEKFEFDGMAPVAMTGGTAAHSAIQRNLLFLLTGALRGKPCQPHGSELKIEVAGRIRYPDAFVVCSPVPLRATVVADPVIVFEIVSDSSAITDLVIKNGEYRATPSVQCYVVLQQTRIGAVAFTRNGDDWATQILDASAVLTLPRIAVELSLIDLYADVLDDQPIAAATDSAARSPSTPADKMPPA